MSEDHGHQKQASYAKCLIKYYFSGKPRSILTILYFIFFFYFVIFYLDNILLALRFIISTIFSYTASLSAENLIWGSIFIVNLILPFMASVAALIIPYEMTKKPIRRSIRTILVLVVAFVITHFVLFTDWSISYVEKQIPIKTFLESKNIPVKN
jgi:hypothetical protein